MISNNFFCNDKDAINQLTEEQLKLSKIRGCNTQRIIFFIAFFDFGKRIFDLKNGVSQRTKYISNNI